MKLKILSWNIWQGVYLEEVISYLKEIVLTQSEINFLNAEYESYISRLRADWLAQNRINSKDVYEVMRPMEQKKYTNILTNGAGT